MPKFIDEVRFTVEGGKGGNGAVSFERLKYKPIGKPDGGNGGRGGNVILKVNPQLTDLSHLIHSNYYKAGDGRPGGKSRSTGKNGEDVIIEVPPGTVVWENDKKIKELIQKDEEFIIARGGRGGRGNAHFKSPTNRSPKYAERGKKGEKKEITLELKLLADIGLIGYPNAGKSTLLKALTNANPEIGSYPFTTIVPNLGVIYDEHNNHYTIADIPGLIEDAHTGKGLGLYFLKHIERTKILAIVLDVSEEDFIKKYNILLKEMQFYNPDILKKELFIIANKIDLLKKDNLEKVKEELEKLKMEFIPVSALKNINIDKLYKILIKKVKGNEV